MWGVISSIAGGAAAGLAASVAMEPVGAEYPVFDHTVAVSSPSDATIARHAVSAVAGAVVGYMAAHSRTGSRSEDGTRSWGTFLYSVASVIFVPAAGAAIAGEAYPHVAPTSSATANEALAASLAAGTIAFAGYLGALPLLNGHWTKKSEPADPEGAMAAGGFGDGEGANDGLLTLGSGVPRSVARPLPDVTLLHRLAAFVGGAASGITISAGAPLPPDHIPFYDMNLTNTHPNDFAIAKYAASGLLGGFIGLLVVESAAGTRPADGNRSWAALLFQAGSFILVPVGVAAAGSSFPSIHPTSSQAANTALAATASGATIVAFASAALLPAMNDWRTRPLPKGSRRASDDVVVPLDKKHQVIGSYTASGMTGSLNGGGMGAAAPVLPAATSTPTAIAAALSGAGSPSSGVAAAPAPTPATATPVVPA